MRKSRFNEQQIIGILEGSEAGMPTAELCRKHGIVVADAIPVEGEVRQMEVSEAKRLRALEEENRQLRHTVAELLLDKRALQAVVTKMVSPQLQRPAVVVMRSEVAGLERRACR